MYKNPKRFFVRLLLLILFSFINIVVIAAVSAGGPAGLIIGLVLVVINAFLVLAMLVIAAINFFKFIFDKSEDKGDNFFMHLVNLIFALGVTTIVGVFYVTILAGLMVILLPVLA